MSTHHDPFLRRVNLPIGGKFGREVGRRDKLLGLAFIAVLLFGVWWILLRPTPYAVARQDLQGVLYFTDSRAVSTHHEFYGHFGQSDVVVVVGIGNDFSTMTERAQIILAQMLLENRYPHATVKRFSNAIVVCGVPQDCSNLARDVEASARERESHRRAVSD
ncbi:MAG: hypothetical protein O3B95_08645 [Chloroflexi bacterium]|nr:hypothetical protein [Chloroflexota bacterium]